MEAAGAAIVGAEVKEAPVEGAFLLGKGALVAVGYGAACVGSSAIGGRSHLQGQNMDIFCFITVANSENLLPTK
jgi:hypothetical protein